MTEGNKNWIDHERSLAGLPPLQKAGYSKGGFEDRFRVTRVDGQPINPKARYLVMDYGGRDIHACRAIEAYANSVQRENPQLAADLRAALSNPEDWPAQHD